MLARKEEKEPFGGNEMITSAAVHRSYFSSEKAERCRMCRDRMEKQKTAERRTGTTATPRHY